MRDKRKLAAVLAADVVEYSRLMRSNEGSTHARLKEHLNRRLKPALRRNTGRLFKETGDGALAEFSSAVYALECAIEFQRAVWQANAIQPEGIRIVFRIGLHVGDMIVDGADLYGDAVTVAARLQAQADPGGIVISGALHDTTVGRAVQAKFVDLGRLALKHIDHPVQAYRVEWEQKELTTALANAVAKYARPFGPRELKKQDRRPNPRSAYVPMHQAATRLYNLFRRLPAPARNMPDNFPDPIKYCCDFIATHGGRIFAVHPPGTELLEVPPFDLGFLNFAENGTELRNPDGEAEWIKAAVKRVDFDRALHKAKNPG